MRQWLMVILANLSPTGKMRIRVICMQNASSAYGHRSVGRNGAEVCMFVVRYGCFFSSHQRCPSPRASADAEICETSDAGNLPGIHGACLGCMASGLSRGLLSRVV